MPNDKKLEEALDEEKPEAGESHAIRLAEELSRPAGGEYALSRRHPRPAEAVPEVIGEETSRAFYAANDPKSISLLYVDSRYRMDRHSPADVQSWQEEGRIILGYSINLFFTNSVFGAIDVYHTQMQHRPISLAIVHAALRKMPNELPDPKAGYHLVRRMRASSTHFRLPQPYIIGCDMRDVQPAELEPAADYAPDAHMDRRDDVGQKLVSALHRYKWWVDTRRP